MSGMIAIFGSVAIVLAARLFFRKESIRLAYMTVAGAFAFWYWIPAANLLTVSYIGVDDFTVSTFVDDACWWVFVSECAALVALVLARPSFGIDVGKAPDVLSTPPPALGVVAGLMSLVYLIIRFSDSGFGVILDLVRGIAGARTNLSFENRSASVWQSLLALLEIVSLWVALFALSWSVLARRVLGIVGVAAICALAILFIASGTRAVLLQAIIAVLFSVSVRDGRRRRIAPVHVMKVLAATVPIYFMLEAVGAAFAARFAADGGYAGGGVEGAVAATFLVNNDMMRELAVALESATPSADGIGDYLLTPFTYSLPTFLGFEKSIPRHLVDYNQLRANIDIVNGGGNVFPGLVADWWMLLGSAAPLAVAAFVAFWALAIEKSTGVAPACGARRAVRIVGYSYLFFCFRNVTGALALVVGLGWLVPRAMDWWAVWRAPGSVTDGAR